MPIRKVFRDSDSEAEGESDQEQLEIGNGDSENGSDEELLAGSDDDGGDDSDAPEELTFTSGKESALGRVKDALQQIQNEKQQQKQKRKIRDEQFKLQKKQKLASLVHQQRLPDDVLQSISSKPKEVHTLSAQTPEAESNEDSESDAESDADKKDTEEYISLESPTGIQVRAVKQELQKTISTVQKAEQFRQDSLYGRRIHRESVKSWAAKKAKRKAARR